MHVAICDFIADCLQNSIEAESGKIVLDYIQDGSLIRTKISDNGKGMDSGQLERVVDPFYTDGIKHVKRKVGLGIPFLVQAVNLADGSFSIDSEEGIGTTIKFVFDKKHIDTPPEGDIVSVVLQSMMFDGSFELEFMRKIIKSGIDRNYVIRRSELISALGDLNSSASVNLAREFIRSQEEDLIKETGNG